MGKNRHDQINERKRRKSQSHKKIRHEELSSREQLSTKPKPLNPQTRVQEMPQPTLLQRFGRGILTLLAIVGGVYAIYSMRPRIEVSLAESSADPTHPLAAKFAVTNKSDFSLSTVSVQCKVDHVFNRTGHDMMSNDTVINQDYSASPSLTSGESMTVACLTFVKFSGAASAEKADAEIITQYGYPGFWKRRIQRYRFIGRADETGIFHWDPQPVQP